MVANTIIAPQSALQQTTISDLNGVALSNYNHNIDAAWTAAGKAGIRYYRLKQHDLDGTVHDLGVRTVRFDEAALSVQLFPNPFVSHFTAQISAGKEEQAKMVMLDALGHIVTERQLSLNAGENRVEMDVDAGLKAGAYLIQIQWSGNVLRSVLIKQ